MVAAFPVVVLGKVKLPIAVKASCHSGVKVDVERLVSLIGAAVAAKGAAYLFASAGAIGHGYPLVAQLLVINLFHCHPPSGFHWAWSLGRGGASAGMWQP